jgi:signal transduction histidine kinase
MAPPPHLLVVDDEPSVATTVEAVLELEGYRCRSETTAAGARRLLETEQFDVALLDLRLEDADGIEFLHELHERQPECVAILLTGYASLESAVRAIREGAYDYLMKPCDLDELRLTVARAAEHGAMARALRQRVEELEAANARVRSLASELQQRVDRATADLSKKVEELSEAKQGLETAQLQRREFISMIVHELGQPLTNITGYAQLLGRETLSPETRDRARTTIISEARRLDRLVQDLADVSSLTSGRFSINATEYDLHALLREQSELARAKSERHTVVVDAGSEPLAALGDRDRIAQLLSNLLGNAIKYSEGGQIRTSIAVRGAEVRIEVRDEGPGIPPDRLHSVFEPHVRLPTTVPGSEPEGSGLGLFIAREIVHAHGGRIWAESDGLRGTSFVILLPLRVTAAPQEELIGS